jgi:hypothetical protein
MKTPRLVRGVFFDCFFFAWLSVCVRYICGSCLVLPKGRSVPPSAGYLKSPLFVSRGSQGSGSRFGLDFVEAFTQVAFCGVWPGEAGRSRAKASDSANPVGAWLVSGPHPDDLPRSGSKNQASRLCLIHRMRRICCRFPADRGTSRAPTPSAESKTTLKSPASSRSAWLLTCFSYCESPDTTQRDLGAG